MSDSIDNPDNPDNYNTGIFDPEGKNLNPLNGQHYSEQYKVLAKMWSNLPAYKQAKEIVESIKKNEIIVTISATGSGKSVCLPIMSLYAVNYKGRVVMTLPKKIITKKAAEFGAKILDVPLGEQVGYQFRGDNLKSNKTVLLYSTDGSIISQIKSDPLLRSIDILIIDEAHERKVQIDLLLYLVKNAIKMRKEKGMRPLKLIIMSATINEKIFADYYKEFAYDYMFLSGTPNYPIETTYLESGLDIKSSEYLESGSNIIYDLIKKINLGDIPDGDILFFVCTVKECDETAEKIGSKLADSFVMGLYSGFDAELEQYISSPIKFKELNSNFKRRIFVSTNVAESSLTIDGIVYVVDSGLELSVKYDPNNQINVMTKNFITKAQMAQRKGRAGRTKPGYCYKLYTPKEEENARDFPDPEIKQIDLKNVCMSLMKIGYDITKSDFSVEQTIEMFTQFIEPPQESYIVDGFDYNIRYGLINPEGFMTQIGKLIVDSRLDIMDGLTLLYAYNISSIAFKKAFKIISICSLLKSGPEDFFYEDINPDTKTNILNRLKKTSSDSEHILLYQIYKFIESEPNESIFNMELYKQIEQVYSNQIDKIKRIYDKYNISIDIIKKDLNHNIICAFNYGYKANQAFKRGNEFKYNSQKCNLDKVVFDYKNYSSIIFYSNVLINGKFNITICSPLLLE